MSVGRRLVEERERLGLSQAAFFAACGVSKKAQFNFENDHNIPGGAYLIAASALGVDVGYVLTGRRSSAALEPEEQALLSMYRAASKDARNAALGALIGATSAHAGTVQKYQGDGGVMIGTVSGQANVRASKKKG